MIILKQLIKDFMSLVVKYELNPGIRLEANVLLDKINTCSFDSEARDIIINFLREKLELIDNFIGQESKYITDVEIDEIMNWPLHHCIHVITSFGGPLDSLDGDRHICPWCILYNNYYKPRCKHCQYGSLYGNCIYDDTSRYYVISKAIKDKLREKNIGNLFSPISSVPGMKVLIERYNKICKDFIGY